MKSLSYLFSIIVFSSIASATIDFVHDVAADKICEAGSVSREYTKNSKNYEVLCSAEQLLSIQSSEERLKKAYILGSDIDLEALANSTKFTIGSGPFGHSEEMSFQGELDGNSHSISNFYYDDEEKYYVGLFGMTRNAKIHNLKIDKFSVNGSAYTGSLIGKAVDTIVENVRATSVWVRGHRVQGGLVGAHIFDVVLKEGIIRERLEQGTDKYFKNIFVTGVIEARSGHTGGVIGYNHYPLSNVRTIIRLSKKSSSSYAKGYVVGYNFGGKIRNAKFFPLDYEFIYGGLEVPTKFDFWEEISGAERYEVCSDNAYRIKSMCKDDSNGLMDLELVKLILKKYFPLNLNNRPEFFESI